MSMTLYIDASLRGAATEHPVESFKEASKVYAKERDKAGEGVSTFPFGDLVDNETNEIFRVSYNGRVWKGEQLIFAAEA